MTATDDTARVLSREQLLDLFTLLQEVDSVELKLTVPDSDRRSALAALGIDPLEAHIRQVYFLDTPDLALSKAGVVARARRVQHKGDDSVVKLRPVVPGDLPGRVRKSPNFLVEVDVMPGGFVCSGSLKAKLGTTEVKETVGGQRPLRKLFSKEQRAFFAEHAPADLELDGLSILGPVNVLKLKFSPQGLGRKLAAELWNYPDDSRLLELSTRTRPPDAFTAAAQTKDFLTGCGVEVGGVQQTKTRTAMEYFSRQLRESR